MVKEKEGKGRILGTGTFGRGNHLVGDILNVVISLFYEECIFFKVLIILPELNKSEVTIEKKPPRATTNPI